MQQSCLNEGNCSQTFVRSTAIMKIEEHDCSNVQRAFPELCSKEQRNGRRQHEVGQYNNFDYLDDYHEGDNRSHSDTIDISDLLSIGSSILCNRDFVFAHGEATEFCKITDSHNSTSLNSNHYADYSSNESYLSSISKIRNSNSCNNDSLSFSKDSDLNILTKDFDSHSINKEHDLNTGFRQHVSSSALKEDEVAIEVKNMRHCSPECGENYRQREHGEESEKLGIRNLSDVMSSDSDYVLNSNDDFAPNSNGKDNITVNDHIEMVKSENEHSFYSKTYEHIAVHCANVYAAAADGNAPDLSIRMFVTASNDVTDVGCFKNKTLSKNGGTVFKNAPASDDQRGGRVMKRNNSNLDDAEDKGSRNINRKEGNHVKVDLSRRDLLPGSPSAITLATRRCHEQRQFKMPMGLPIRSPKMKIPSPHSACALGTLKEDRRVAQLKNDYELSFACTGETPQRRTPTASSVNLTPKYLFASSPIDSVQYQEYFSPPFTPITYTKMHCVNESFDNRVTLTNQQKTCSHLVPNEIILENKCKNANFSQPGILKLRYNSSDEDIRDQKDCGEDRKIFRKINFSRESQQQTDEEISSSRNFESITDTSSTSRNEDVSSYKECNLACELTWELQEDVVEYLSERLAVMVPNDEASRVHHIKHYRRLYLDKIENLLHSIVSHLSEQYKCKESMKALQSNIFNKIRTKINRRIWEGVDNGCDFDIPYVMEAGLWVLDQENSLFLPKTFESLFVFVDT